MKKIYPTLLLLVIAFFFSSCDDIAPDERYIPVEKTNPRRAVLIEDFTGQDCVNCPAAHRIMESLEKQYPENVIPVSIHCGEFGISVDRTRYPAYIGLMQPEGNIYNDRYAIKAWPKGVVNRRSGALSPSDWTDVVRTEMETEAGVEIELGATLGPDGNITITSTIKPMRDISAGYQIWIIENGIVAFQKDKDLGRIPDSVHNNVFRACVNGTDGEAISIKEFIHTDLKHSIALRDNDRERWNPEQLYVVAFLQDDSGVIQAARTHVATQSQTITSKQ